MTFHSLLLAFHTALFTTAQKIHIVEGVFQKSQQLLMLCNQEEIPIARSKYEKGLIMWKEMQTTIKPSFNRVLMYMIKVI